MNDRLGLQGHLLRWAGAALVAGVLAGGVLATAYVPMLHAASTDDLPRLKAAFRRPATVPFPPANPFSEPKRALGEMLFHDPILSGNGQIACASCHDRVLGFADGREWGVGVPGRPLGRHTPTLWNLAWASHVFWDGRARSLEEQATGPIESTDEMAQPLAPLIERLAKSNVYPPAFAAAFPTDPRVSVDNLTKALATFERTLVSPVTRFDRWIEGDEQALTPQEIAGFRLFTGKASCANCHSGWSFTDHAFHDIGLPGDDRGRGAVLRLDRVEHAFKTPGLREIARSAPYMHDGSLNTLDDVLTHYQSGIVDRPTLSSDLPRALSLSADERAALIAFLGTLTSSDDPVPAPIVAAIAGPSEPALRATTVSQHDKSFSPTHIALARGQRVWILNNDTRTHNVRVFDPKMEFDSGAQEPGETVEITFAQPGSFLVFCGIHPKMELYVDVSP